MEQIEINNRQYFNKIPLLILGLLVLYLAGNINVVNLLIIIVLTIIIFFVHEVTLYYLAAGLLILWATIFYLNENWLIPLGNLTYIMLFLASIVGIFKGQTTANININWQKYIVIAAFFSLVVLVGFSGYRLWKDRNRINLEKEEAGWTIDVENPKIREDLPIAINNIKKEKHFLVVWQKPDGQIFSFKTTLEENNNKIIIYDELIDESGKYSLSIGDGETMKTKEIEIK